MTDTLSFLDATERVLTERGEPMHYHEITQRAMGAGLLASRGKTPEASLNAQVANVRAQSSAKSYLSYRLRSLLQRGLVDRSGRSFEITSNGLSYLESAVDIEARDEPEADLTSEIRRLQEALRHIHVQLALPTTP